MQYNYFAMRCPNCKYQFDSLVLTPRETQVLKLIAEGLQIKEVALVMKVAPKTASGFRANAYRKTGIKNIAGAVHYAISRRLIKLIKTTSLS